MYEWRMILVQVTADMGSVEVDHVGVRSPRNVVV